MIRSDEMGAAYLPARVSIKQKSAIRHLKFQTYYVYTCRFLCIRPYIHIYLISSYAIAISFTPARAHTLGEIPPGYHHQKIIRSRRVGPRLYSPLAGDDHTYIDTTSTRLDFNCIASTLRGGL